MSLGGYITICNSFFLLFVISPEATPGFPEDKGCQLAQNMRAHAPTTRLQKP